MKKTAIILAAGAGKRMGTQVAKQYLNIGGKPILYYSLKTFQESIVDSIVLVVGKDENEYINKEFVQKYNFTKVRAVVEGGKERYHSVINGLKEIPKVEPDCEYVFIHDGARPFLNQEIIIRAYNSVIENGACAVGMPVKDTIKMADKEGFVESTPNREYTWAVQTPQVFDYKIIKGSYELLSENEQKLISQGISITDDAMVVETLLGKRVKLVEGSYENIKITTSSDLDIAEAFMARGAQESY